MTPAFLLTHQLEALLQSMNWTDRVDRIERNHMASAWSGVCDLLEWMHGSICMHPGRRFGVYNFWMRQLLPWSCTTMKRHKAKNLRAASKSMWWQANLEFHRGPPLVTTKPCIHASTGVGIVGRPLSQCWGKKVTGLFHLLGSLSKVVPRTVSM